MNHAMKTIFKITFVIFSLILSKSIYAQNDDSSEWSFSILFGVHQPSLKSLNQGLFKSPVAGSGGIIIDPVTEETEERDFVYQNDLPDSQVGGKAAFELQWHANPRHSLLFGMGSWERTSVAQQYVDIPSQGAMNKADYERRAKITYTEYSLGWNYHFWRKPKYAFYLRSSIHQVFDIDYREDHVFSYISGSGLEGFERIRILEAQTAALFMGQLALGTQWYFAKWFSIAMEAGYLRGERSIQLRDAKEKTNFIARDDVNFDLPYKELADGSIGYMSSDTDGNPTYSRMKLDFSGWQLLFRINIHY